MRSFRNALILATIAMTSAASAAGDDAKAAALYDEAKALVTAGKWAEACPKLAESHRLAPKMYTVYRLAECYEHTGQRASSLKRYREAAIEATKAGETSKAKAALERAEKLEPTVPKLTLQLDGQTGLEVRVDDVVFPADAPTMIDPGAHSVSISAPNKKTYRTTVKIPDDASTTNLVIPPLAEAEKDAPPAVVAPVAAPTPEAPPTPSNTTRTIGMVLAGTGVVAIGVGGYLALSARSKYHDADAHCPAAGCDDIGAKQTEDARSLGNVATVVMGAGLAIGVTGAVLWLTAPSKSDNNAAKVGLTVLPGGLLLNGSF